jgi:glycosyltransferase involved in cell wall biosynthesis
MRILLINLLYDPYNHGGAEKATLVLARALLKAGDQVVVVSLYPGKSQTTEIRDGVRVHRLPLDNIYWPLDLVKKKIWGYRAIWHLKDMWNWRSARRIGKILDEERPDIVHTHNLSGVSVSVWKEIKKRNIPLVHTMHDYYLLCIRSDMFSKGLPCQERCLECKLSTVLRKKWSQRVDTVVSVSEYVLDKHRQCGYFKDVPGAVIYNIEPSVSRASNQVSLSNLKSDDLMVFGFIGRVNLVKGVAELLEATTHLADSRWKLRIAGVGPEDYIENLKQKYTDPRIEWLGYTTADEFYASIDVTVIPSIWNDPLPYVMIESFAAGKGVICAKLGGMPELARLGKKVATYEASDVHSLARTMDAAMSNPAAWRAGGFANEEARDSFEENAILAQYRSVYENVRKSNAEAQAASL